jgi:NADP-dependent 3-hydroxy acid dehydrogenase YdfG
LTNGLRQELRSTPVRVVGIYPPNIEDISPLEPAWQESATRPKSAGITNRDVVEAALFALGRPRNCTIATLVLDADEEGMYADHGSPA